jgi:hypothetical protein
MNDADPGELTHWAGLFLDKLKAIPSITDVTTDQLNAGPMLDTKIKRDVAENVADFFACFVPYHDAQMVPGAQMFFLVCESIGL